MKRIKLTPEALAIALRAIYTLLKTRKVYSSRYLFNNFKHDLTYIPNHQLILNILSKQGILLYEHQEWKWNSPVEPNLKMAKAIIDEIEKIKNQSKKVTDYNAEALFLIRRALVLMEKKSQHKDVIYSDDEGNLITSKVAIIMR